MKSFYRGLHYRRLSSLAVTVNWATLDSKNILIIFHKSTKRAFRLVTFIWSALQLLEKINNRRRRGKAKGYNMRQSCYFIYNLQVRIRNVFISKVTSGLFLALFVKYHRHCTLAFTSRIAFESLLYTLGLYSKSVFFVTPAWKTRFLILWKEANQNASEKISHCENKNCV